MENALYGRKCTLALTDGDRVLDLSDMHITFETRQEDEQHPDNCRIRVHNLSRETVRTIKGEYSKVVLQAGYEGVGVGVIFDGTIKQWGEGREANRVDTYLDILAADGDLAYNFSFVNATFAKGSTPRQRTEAAVRAMNPEGARAGKWDIPETGGVLPRGRVLFGLARDVLRRQTDNYRATWTIQGGKVHITRLDEYHPSTVVVLNSLTGLIGRAEQTTDGVKARCLINPRINVGCLVQIDNAAVNRISQQKNIALPMGQIPYNQWTGIQMLADVTSDGLYRVYVSEFRGDNRGDTWYQDLILLAIDPATKKVKSNG